MKPKQIRASMFFLSSQYKKNKQRRAIAGTEEILDAGVEALLELEHRLTRLEEIIFNQRQYTRHLHAQYKWCKNKLVEHNLFDRDAMDAYYKKKCGLPEETQNDR